MKVDKWWYVGVIVLIFMLGFCGARYASGGSVGLVEFFKRLVGGS